MVVTPLASAWSICCGQMKWMCAIHAARRDDAALARDDFRGRANRHAGRDAALDARVTRVADAP